MTLVKDIMIRDITAVSPDDSMITVARVLANHCFSGVPVVDDKGRVIGFISDKDLVKSEFPNMERRDEYFVLRDFAEIATRLSHVGESSVKDYMNPHPITVREDDPAIDVVKLILQMKIKVVPVTRDGILVGAVGRTQICRIILEKGDI